MASLTSIGPIAGVGASIPMGLSTDTYFMALAEKNEEHGANVCGEVHQEYNKRLKEQGLEVHSIPGKTLNALGMDQSTPIARPDLYYLAIHNVLLSYGDTTGIKIEITTDTFFNLLHEENVKNSRNMRGEVNSRYNQLLEENGESAEIFGHDLEALGMDQKTRLSRPDLYFKAFEEVVKKTPSSSFDLEARVTSVAGKILSRVFTKSREEITPSLEIAIETMATAGSPATPEISAICSKVNTTLQKIIALLSSPLSDTLDNTLCHAAILGDVDVVRALLEAGADVHACNDDAALYQAAANGHAAVVKLLVDAGADVHANNGDALYQAAGNGHAAVVKLLVDAGADVHVSNNGPLLCAAMNGHVDTVRVLLTAGSTIHMYGELALRNAAANGHADVVKLLLGAGADVHAEDDQALCLAASYGHAAVVKLLLDAGADMRVDNDSPLRSAVAKGHAAVVGILLEAYSALSNPDGSEINVSDILFPGFLEAIRTRHMGRENLTALNYLKSGFEIEPSHVEQIVEALEASGNFDGFGPIGAACLDAGWNTRRAAVAWIASHPKGPYSKSVMAAAAS